MTCVGKVAPPRPTIPAALMRSMISLGSRVHSLTRVVERLDALFPLLLFALCDGDDDGGALVAARIEEAIDLRDLASDGGVDVGRYEARRLGDDSTYLDEVALLDGRGGRCTDVLADGYDDLTRQWKLLDGALS